MTRAVGVYHEPGRASASVELSWREGSRTLVVRGDGVAHDVATGDLDVASGGWQGQALHLVWPGRGSVTIDDPATLDALERWLPAGLAQAVRAQRRSVGRARRRGRTVLAVVVAAVLLPFVAFATLLIHPDPLLDAAVAGMPTSVDAAIGEQVARQVRTGGRLVDDPVVTGAVEAIADRLLAAVPSHDFAFRFFVVREPSVNAFAAPGGVVVVHTGLLAEAASAEEVAGVVAHEIGHVLGRHSLRQMAYGLGVWTGLGLLVGSADAAVAALADAAGRLGDLAFSRDQERDADERGLALLVDAGVDPSGMATFFERIAASAGGPPALLSTHPHGAERAERVRARLAEIGRRDFVPIGVDWDAVRAAAR